MNKTRPAWYLPLLLATVWLAACNSPAPTVSPPPPDQVSRETDLPPAPTEVTFYLAGMNQRLKIL